MDLLTPKDVKKILKCSLPWVYKAAEKGTIPCVRWECPGERETAKTMVRFKLEDVMEFINAHYQVNPS